MDKSERDQVRLILEHLDEEFRRKSAGRQKAMHAEHSAKGLLRSGATVKRAVRIAEEEASAYVKKAVLDVADVAQDMAAFALIEASLIAMFRGWEDEVAHAVRLATAGGAGGMDSVSSAANNLFAEMKGRIVRELEIHRFTFLRPTRADMASLISRPPEPQSEARASAKNPGGKPLAAHWDELWATIAVQLWTGDLKPKKQADIKRAMLDWFTAHEIEVGDTAVTDRARQLWRKIEAAQ